MTTGRRVAASHQLTFAELQIVQDQAVWQATNTKVYSDLVAGDVVQLWQDAAEPLVGWCATRHPVTDAWELVLDRTWTPFVRRATRPVWPNCFWRWVCHDSAWVLAPNVAEVLAWMTEYAEGLPVDRFHRLAYAADYAWPIGMPKAWQREVWGQYTMLAIQHVPLAALLKHQRHTSKSGTRIFSCPPRIQAVITHDIWALPGDQRLAAILALRWPRSEKFGPECPMPNGLQAFNPSLSVHLYGGYYRWAMAHAETPRQLLELCDAWGSNPVPACDDV